MLWAKACVDDKRRLVWSPPPHILPSVLTGLPGAAAEEPPSVLHSGDSMFMMMFGVTWCLTARLFNVGHSSDHRSFFRQIQVSHMPSGRHGRVPGSAQWKVHFTGLLTPKSRTCMRIKQRFGPVAVQLRAGVLPLAVEVGRFKMFRRKTDCVSCDLGEIMSPTHFSNLVYRWWKTGMVVQLWLILSLLLYLGFTLIHPVLYSKCFCQWLIIVNFVVSLLFLSFENVHASTSVLVYMDQCCLVSPLRLCVLYARHNNKNVIIHCESGFIFASLP